MKLIGSQKAKCQPLKIKEVVDHAGLSPLHLLLNLPKQSMKTLPLKSFLSNTSWIVTTLTVAAQVVG